MQTAKIMRIKQHYEIIIRVNVNCHYDEINYCSCKFLIQEDECIKVIYCLHPVLMSMQHAYQNFVSSLRILWE